MQLQQMDYGVMGGMTRDWVDAFGPIRIVTSEYAEREILAPLHANLPQTKPIIEKEKKNTQQRQETQALFLSLSIIVISVISTTIRQLHHFLYE